MASSSAPPWASEVGLGGEQAPGRTRPASSGLREFSEQTEVGGVFLQALMRRQLRLSLTIALAFGAFLGVQPLLSAVWSPWTSWRLFGVPVTWLVLGVGSYPLLIWLGRHYVRRAEEVDEEFTDLLR
ncbi:MAG: hypothetical protein WBU92_06135 [Candidatus Dormiibacterota bacterium]